MAGADLCAVTGGQPLARPATRPKHLRKALVSQGMKDRMGWAQTEAGQGGQWVTCDISAVRLKTAPGSVNLFPSVSLLLSRLCLFFLSLHFSLTYPAVTCVLCDAHTHTSFSYFVFISNVHMDTYLHAPTVMHTLKHTGIHVHICM